MNIDIQTGYIYPNSHAIVRPFMKEEVFIAQFAKDELAILGHGTAVIYVKAHTLTDKNEVLKWSVGVRTGKIICAALGVYPDYDTYHLFLKRYPRDYDLDAYKLFVENYLVRVLGSPPYIFSWGEIRYRTDRDMGLPYIDIQYRRARKSSNGNNNPMKLKSGLGGVIIGGVDKIRQVFTGKK